MGDNTTLEFALMNVERGLRSENRATRWLWTRYAGLDITVIETSTLVWEACSLFPKTVAKIFTFILNSNRFTVRCAGSFEEESKDGNTGITRYNIAVWDAKIHPLSTLKKVGALFLGIMATCFLHFINPSWNLAALKNLGLYSPDNVELDPRTPRRSGRRGSFSKFDATKRSNESVRDSAKGKGKGLSFSEQIAQGAGQNGSSVGSEDGQNGHASDAPPEETPIPSDDLPVPGTVIPVLDVPEPVEGPFAGTPLPPDDLPPPPDLSQPARAPIVIPKRKKGLGLGGDPKGGAASKAKTPKGGDQGDLAAEAQRRAKAREERRLQREEEEKAKAAAGGAPAPADPTSKGTGIQQPGVGLGVNLRSSTAAGTRPPAKSSSPIGQPKELSAKELLSRAKKGQIGGAAQPAPAPGNKPPPAARKSAEAAPKDP